MTEPRRLLVAILAIAVLAAAIAMVVSLARSEAGVSELAQSPQDVLTRLEGLGAGRWHEEVTGGRETPTIRETIPAIEEASSSVVRGTVLASTAGHEPLPSIMAYAWPINTEPTLSTARRAPVKPDGTFAIVVDPRCDRFTVAAGGGGWVSNMGTECRRGETCELRLEPLWGARLVVGRHPKELPRCQHWAFMVVTAPEEMSLVEPTGVAAEIAEVAEMGERVLNDWRDALMLYRGNPAVSPPRLEVTYDVAGFDKITVEPHLRLVSESVTAFRLSIPQKANGFGTVAVRLQSSFKASKGKVWRDYWSPHELHFLRKPDGKRLSVPMTDLSSRVLEIGDVPYGDYTWKMRSRFGWVVAGEEMLQVANPKCAITVRIPDTTTLRVTVSDENRGDLYHGPAIFLLKTKQRTVRLPFAGPPYELDGVPKDDWEVELEHPKGVSPSTLQSGDSGTVLAGQLIMRKY